jgi:AraC-like DNA-binding protein
MIDDVFQKTADMPSVPHQGVLYQQDFADHYRVRHYAVAPQLQPYIEYIWVISWELPPGESRQSPAILPDPQINIYFEGTDAGVQGVFTTRRAYEAKGSAKVAGARFRPAGFYAFWPHPAAELTDRNLPLAAIFPEADARFAMTLLALEDDQVAARIEALLQTVQPLPDANITLAQTILAAIRDDMSLQTVAAVAKKFAKSERAVQQLFQTYVGVGVKWALLRSRLLDALEQVRSGNRPDWPVLALELGYNSQAHFITDFKRVMGVTPTEYEATSQHAVDA